MAFTYELGSLDDAVKRIAQVRLRLGDWKAGEGVRPDDSNLTDEEITQFLTDEGDHIMRAVAACCEAMATEWSKVATTRIGPLSEDLGNRAAEFAARAASLREQHGYASSSPTRSGSVAPRRLEPSEQEQQGYYQ